MAVIVEGAGEACGHRGNPSALLVYRARNYIVDSALRMTSKSLSAKCCES